MARNLFALSAALGISLLLILPSVAGAVNVCGSTLGPGGTVTLDMDQNCNSNPAFTVVGPVTVNLNGFTVRCADPGQDGIRIEGTEAKVHNGVVTRCSDGVFVLGSEQKVERMVAKENSHNGFVNEAADSKFANNTATWNDDYGFRNKGADSKFTTNIATNNGDYGFWNEGADSKFTGNISTSNDLDGFVHSFGDNCTFTANTATDNGDNGFRIFGTNSKFTNNVATSNGFDGFLNSYGATENTFNGNLALGNTSEDLEDANAACDNNTWKNNVFGSSEVAGGANPGCIQ